jgi:ribosomal protein L40E
MDKVDVSTRGNVDTFFCPRCGSEMKVNARYCMKCGYLNINNEKNKGMKKFIKNNKEKYVMGQGRVIRNVDDNVVLDSLATNTGNRLLCFLFNIVLFFFVLGLNIVPRVNNGEIDFHSLVISSFPILIIITSLMFLYFYGLELIYMKANKRWWSAIIPIYNIFVLAEMTFGNMLYGLILFIPIVGVIFYIVMIYRLGKAFRYNGILTVLLFPLMVLIIGFGTHYYMNKRFVKKFHDNNKTVEEDYRIKRAFLVINIIVIILGVSLIIYGNFGKVKKASNLLGNSYYIYASKYIVYSTKLRVDQGNFKCNGYSSMTNDGVYYFYYDDAGKDLYLLFSLSREPIEAYVKVIREKGVNTYYISLSDGTYGFDETLSSKVKLKSVVKYNDVENKYNNSGGIKCYFKYADALAKKS